jgi:hypothetical protein
MRPELVACAHAPPRRVTSVAVITTAVIVIAIIGG